MKAFGLLVFLLVGLCSVRGEPPAWSRLITTGKGPGSFPPMPDVRLHYAFGWSGIRAATAEVRLSSNGDSLQASATAATLGLARTLFKLDVQHNSISKRATYLPVHIIQDEKYAKEDVHTDVDFRNDSVLSTREVKPAKNPVSPKQFTFFPVYSMESALLWIRSQPLQNDDRETMVVYANNAAYLATIRVVGRETIRVGETETKAIKLDLQLKAIDDHLQLKSHQKFKSGRGWLSDDQLRLPLRLEADIFIGYIYAELVSSELN